MIFEETLSGFSTFETVIFALAMGVIIALSGYIIFKGVKIMAKRLWRPADKTNPRNIYICTVCKVPHSTQMGLSEHMATVHDTKITQKEAKAITEVVSYDTWEQIRLDEEAKLIEFETAQEEIDTKAIAQLTQDPTLDPENIINPDVNSDPETIYKELSDELEKPSVLAPTADVFNVQYMGAQVFLDIAMTVPNTPEVIEAINKLNAAMGK